VVDNFPIFIVPRHSQIECLNKKLPNRFYLSLGSIWEVLEHIQKGTECIIEAVYKDLASQVSAKLGSPFLL